MQIMTYRYALTSIKRSRFLMANRDVLVQNMQIKCDFFCIRAPCIRGPVLLNSLNSLGKPDKMLIFYPISLNKFNNT